MSQTARIMQEENVFAGGIVVVKVGKAKNEIHVHRRLLQSRSPYFKQLLASRYNGTNTLVLDDVDADTFSRFLSWLYADSFIVPKDNEWIGLCKLWILAERFQVPELQNQVVRIISSCLYQSYLSKLDLEVIHYIYDNTGPGSKLRMLFAHISVWYGCQDGLAQITKDWPPVFNTDYAALEVEKAQKTKEKVSVNSRDLTGFLLPEVAVADSERSAKVKVESDGDNTLKRRHDSLMEDRQMKREKTN